MQNPSAPLPVAGSLVAAVVDAERLLRYASAKGIAVPKDVVEKIVSAKQLLSANGSDPATFKLQEEFWFALTQLSAATQPATLESLRYASTAPEPGRWDQLWSRLTRTRIASETMGEQAVRRARGWALLGLVIVALLQAYYEVGTRTRSDYTAASRRYDSNVTLIAQTSATRAALPPAATATEAPSLKDKIAAAEAENTMLLENTERKLLLMRNMLLWVNWGPAEVAGAHVLSQAILALLDGLLVVLGDFLLPLGWGFLGAALYVSRSLADDIKTMAYAPDRAILHRSRYFMGLVAGFAAAKFFTVLVDTQHGAVTPLALALLVGYSVEVLFTLLDKIIAAFSTR